MKVALAVAPTDSAGREQRTFYHQGIGTNRWDRIRGGAFGFGLSRDIRDAYRFLVQNFSPGDEIFLFGFSRGAYTARSTAGFVRNCGILRRDEADRVDEAYALYRNRNHRTRPRGVESQLFRRSYSHETRIHFIGVWDTVGALGVPLSGLRLVNLVNRRWRFHDTELSSTVDAACQALAIDEQRGPFRPAIWTRTGGQLCEQGWFSGAHSDIGGGCPDPAYHHEYVASPAIARLQLTDNYAPENLLTYLGREHQVVRVDLDFCGNVDKPILAAGGKLTQHTGSTSIA